MSKKFFSVMIFVVTMVILQCSFVYAASLKDPIEKVEITGIDYPYSTGSILDTTAKVTIQSRCVIDYLSWESTAGGLKRVKVTLIPYTYYYFTEETTATINGKTPDDIVLTDKGKLEVYYTFPKDSTSQLPNSAATLTHKITVYYTANGKITPNPIRAPHNKNFTVQIIPDEGYEVSDVLVDGYSEGAITEYTFKKVTDTHKIKAYFKPIEGYVPQENSGDVSENTSGDTTGDISGNTSGDVSGDNVEIKAMNFKDVSENDWFYNNVKFVFENGIFSGVSETEFNPNGNMTRGMMTKVLFNLSKEENNGHNIYNDVFEDDWYFDAVTWASNKNIVSGVGDNKFAPNDNITREQVCVILYNYAKTLDNFEDKNSSKERESIMDAIRYYDAADVSEYAISAIEWAVSSKILTGKTGGLIDPQGYATRAEIATMMTRFIKCI